MGVGSQDETAFAFDGRLKDYYPIAWRNSLLTFATLGLYRSWAINKERQYLWGKTRFIDETIEWTGTGVELFRGFLIGMLIFACFTALSYYLRHFVINEKKFLNYVGGFLLYCVFFWLTSLAGFRGLRYRLSRTTWRGIRGGSNDGGFGFAFQSVGRYILCLIAGIGAFIILGIMFGFMGTVGGAITTFGALFVALACVPIAMSRLFGEKWKRMSFGPHDFTADPSYKRSLHRLFLIAISTSLILIALAFYNIRRQQSATFGLLDPHGSGSNMALSMSILLMFGLFWIAYRAIFNRESVLGLEISTVDFAFTARTKDWLVFMSGQLALTLLAVAIAALIAWPTGILQKLYTFNAESGLTPDTVQFVYLFIIFSIPFAFIAPYIRYRRWRFFIRHIEAGGEIDVEQLTQSETKANKDSEGLLDAFDFGAI